MKYKGVIFDFNGTLFFDNDKHIKAWGAISQLIRGHGISDQELHEHFNGVPNKEIIQYLFNGECDDEMINKYDLDYEYDLEGNKRFYGSFDGFIYAGDWIVRCPNYEIYPISYDVFKQNYEEVKHMNQC